MSVRAQAWASGALAGALLWGGLMLHGLAGPADAGRRLLAALLVLVPLVADALGAPLRRRGAARWLGFASAVAVMILVPATAARGIAFAVAVACLRGPRLCGIEGALLVCTVTTSLAAWFEFARGPADLLASWFGRTFAPREWGLTNLGASGAALPAAFWAVAFVVFAAWGNSWRRALVACTAIFAVLALQWRLVAAVDDSIGPFIGHGHEPEILRNLAFAPWLMVAVVAVAWARVPRAEEQDAQPQTGRRLRFVGAAALGAATCILMSGWLPRGPADRRVAFLNRGGLDWERPTVAKLGLFETGMFGFLPLYLERAGWQVEPVDLPDLPTLASRAQVLVTINGHHLWSEGERASVAAFLEGGGSLLVLGDHTDVFGLERGFDSLLAPWGLGFHFDSAYHSGHSWRDDLEWLPGAQGLGGDPLDVGLSIGASLEVEAPARPWIVARTGFSDTGLHDNAMGAFLGNYQQDEGERLGDLVLGATRSVGRGNIVVLGDTSGFQNFSMSRTWETFVEPLFERLARPARIAVPPTAPALVAMLLLAALVLHLIRSRGRATHATLAACVGFLTFAGLGSSSLPMRSASAAWNERTLWFDETHFPDVGHYSADWNVADALGTAAARAGFAVRDLQTWEPERIGRGDVLALIAPAEALSASEVESLMERMRAGTLVIAAASAAQSRGLKPLLRVLDLDIRPYGLGPLPPVGRQDEREPRFVDASPLVPPQDGKFEPLYRWGDECIALARPVGAGHFVLIGDTRFFSRPNFEGDWGWWPGNLRLVHDLMIRLAHGDEGDTAELLPPAVQPETTP